MSSLPDYVWDRQPVQGSGTVARKDFVTGRWTERYVYSTGRLRGHGTDVYFTPALFSARNRKAENMLPTSWLWADLDEVDPAGLDIVPTVAWLTSPGRWQALWRLDRPLKRFAFEDLNQRLTYAIGADHSGWNAAKVLRIPGSLSTKHGVPYRVTVCMENLGLVHCAADLAARLRHVEVGRSSGYAPVGMPPAPSRSSVRAARAKLPKHLRRKLRTPVRDRSVELYYTYPKLFRLGLCREDVYAVLQDSTLNKWPRSPGALWADICRGHARFMASQR